MTLRYADRVLEQVAAPPTTSPFAISATAAWQTTPAAVSGYQTFANIPLLAANDTIYYTATDGTNVENGLGTWTSGSLARTSILSSSNAGAACTFTGTVTVFNTVPAEVIGPWLIPGLVVDMPSYIPGVPLAGLRVRLLFDRAVTLPASLTGSNAIARVAATAAVSVTINHVVGGTATAVGTLAWAASATVGVFTAASATTFAAGDILEILWPATADTTLADVAITLTGTR